MDPLNPTAPSGEQPSGAPVEPTSEQHVADLTSRMDSLTLPELMKLATGETLVTPPVEPTPEPEVVVPAAEPLEPGEQPAPVVDPVANGDPADPKLPKGRISVRSLPAVEQQRLAEAVELVREGKANDIPSAYRILSGEPEVTPANLDPANPAPTPPQAPAQQADPDVTAIQGKLVELRAQRTAAKAAYDPPEVEAGLTDQIEDLMLELAEAKQVAAARQQQVSSSRNAYVEAVDQMEARYPLALDETSAFYQFLDARVAAAQAADPRIEVTEPGYVLRLADEVEAVLKAHGSAPAAPAVAPTKEPAPPAPARPARPVGSSVPGGQGGQQRQSVEQIQALIENASLEDLMAVASGHG